MYFIVFKMRTAVIERASKINTGMKFKFSTEKQTNKQTKETKANKQTNKQQQKTTPQDFGEYIQDLVT